MTAYLLGITAISRGPPSLSPRTTASIGCLAPYLTTQHKYKYKSLYKVY